MTLQNDTHPNPQTTQATANAIGCSLQTDGKVLQQKTMLMEHGEVEVVPTKNLYLYLLLFMILESTLNSSRGERQT